MLLRHFVIVIARENDVVTMEGGVDRMDTFIDEMEVEMGGSC